MKRVYVENSYGDPFDHEYDIIEKEDSQVLVRSNSASWVEHLRGEEVLTYTNTGEKIVIGGAKKITLDYCEEVELLALLIANNNARLRIEETKVIREI